MTSPLSVIDLNARTTAIARVYSPSGGSSFRGITGNLLMVTRWGDPADLAIIEASRTLADYLDLTEEHSGFRAGEMYTSEGFFPKRFKRGSGDPHGDYVRYAIGILRPH